LRLDENHMIKKFHFGLCGKCGSLIVHV